MIHYLCIVPSCIDQGILDILAGQDHPLGCVIPLRAKGVEEFIKIREKNISHTRIPFDDIPPTVSNNTTLKNDKTTDVFSAPAFEESAFEESKPTIAQPLSMTTPSNSLPGFDSFDKFDSFNTNNDNNQSAAIDPFQFNVTSDPFGSPITTTIQNDPFSSKPSDNNTDDPFAPSSPIEMNDLFASAPNLGSSSIDPFQSTSPIR